MAEPTKEFIKSWCRIGDEFDPILPTMITALTQLAGHLVGVDYTLVDMPKPVQLWVAAQVNHWIDNPRAATAKELFVSPFLDRLLDADRTFPWNLDPPTYGR